MNATRRGEGKWEGGPPNQTWGILRRLRDVWWLRPKEVCKRLFDDIEKALMERKDSA
jgi:hypothetical protein